MNNTKYEWKTKVQFISTEQKNKIYNKTLIFQAINVFEGDVLIFKMHAGDHKMQFCALT